MSRSAVRRERRRRRRRLVVVALILALALALIVTIYFALRDTPPPAALPWRPAGQLA